MHSSRRALRANLLRRGLTATLLLCLSLFAASPAMARHVLAQPAMAAVQHIFVIVLENEPFQVTFGKQSLAPYLAHQLPSQGAMLNQYYGIGHHSLDNYIAMISGQAPNPATQDDCGHYVNFKLRSPKLDANGQALGEGCIYPQQVKTLAGQLDGKDLQWKGYMQDMGANPKREADRCGHVAIGAKDVTNHASASDQYADKHNPFVYFHSIIDRADYCRDHVVNLDQLKPDLASIRSTPNLVYIVPDLCSDGHDAPCANGQPGGLVSVDAFLRTWVPLITASPAFRKNGLLVITFDEGGDATACCGEQGMPGVPQPGGFGPGGGRIGAVLLSPFIKPGTVSNHSYNHYSLLRSMEDFFGLSHLGYAAGPEVHGFGPDVFTVPANEKGHGG